MLAAKLHIQQCPEYLTGRKIQKEKVYPDTLHSLTLPSNPLQLTVPVYHRF